MKLNSKNLYISEHRNGFSVYIEMPDNSRNYLHNQSVKYLPDAVMIMNDFDGDLELDYGNTEIVEVDEYYRIVVSLEDGRGKIQKFHSRRLNVIDAAKEFEMLVLYN